MVPVKLNDSMMSRLFILGWVDTDTGRLAQKTGLSVRNAGVANCGACAGACSPAGPYSAKVTSPFMAVPASSACWSCEHGSLTLRGLDSPWNDGAALSVQCQRCCHVPCG